MNNRMVKLRRKLAIASAEGKYYYSSSEAHEDVWFLLDEIDRLTDKETVDHDLGAVGGWMSAALSDPSVCEDMKKDARKYLDALARNSIISSMNREVRPTEKASGE